MKNVSQYANSLGRCRLVVHFRVQMEIAIQRRRVPVKSIRLCTTASIAAACVMATLAAQSAEAQTYRVLYSFQSGSDGTEPWGGVIRNVNGALYGTTFTGGSSDYGTVFKLSNTGKETILHSFTGAPDGRGPYSGVVADANGNLYGTTFFGGKLSCGRYMEGCGTVFKLSKSGKETVLYTFTGGSDGANSSAGLIMDARGNLYGTTFYGGDLSCGQNGQGCGTVFKLSRSGKETVLHSFTGKDGANPYAGLIMDAQGNLYGTTIFGDNLACGLGLGCGGVFKLSKTGSETVLYSFTGHADGGVPYAGVIVDAKLNLYGTTTIGGASCCGTVFKLTPTGKETVLYSFTGGSDGLAPYAGVIQDSRGNLYGTTYQGGSGGYGTVFKLSKTGKETVLHAFSGADGADLYAGVIMDAKGDLYGSAILGGASNNGVAFKLRP
jgi:uncharacterized repeat protein (TIGR03803 family)